MKKKMYKKHRTKNRDNFEKIQYNFQQFSFFAPQTTLSNIKRNIYIIVRENKFRQHF